MRRCGLAVAAVVTALGVLLPAMPASAHAVLVRTDPVAGTIVDQPPRQVTLTFSEPVDIGLGRVSMLAPDGTNVVEGRPTVRGAQVVAPLRPGLGRGTYLVSYRVVSADGHPIAGGYTFSIQAPSAQARPPDLGSGAAAVDPWVRGLQSAGRYAGYAGIALLVGPLLFLLAFWPRRLASSAPRRLAWLGWGLLLGGTALTFALQAPYATGGTVADLSAGDTVSVLDTGVGQALAVRVALLLAGVALVRRITRGAELVTVDRVFAAVLGAALLLTWPLSGHAAGSPARLLSIPADAVHVAAMAVWLGGLVVLAFALLPRADAGELGAILPAWSRWATYAVVALALSGTVQALVEVGSPGALVSTAYGQLVLAKVAGLGAILVAAAGARGWVRRRLPLPAYAYAADRDGPWTDDAVDGDSPGPPSDDPRDGPAADDQGDAGEVDDPPSAGEIRGLRRRVLVEVGIAAVVLGLATALVQATPARNAAEAATSQDLPYAATLNSKAFALQLSLDPSRVGNNSLHLTVLDRNDRPLGVVEWKARVANPAAGVDALAIPLLPITNNHAVGQVQIPAAGTWTFTFTVRTSDVDQATVTHTVRIT